jgi:four helix bundle protein
MKGHDRIFSFQDLIAWQKSIDFAVKVIGAIDELKAPRRHFKIIEQLEAAATSISMNIAEGKGRYSKKEFMHFLYIARGSLFEVVTLIIILEKIGWLSSEKAWELQKQAEEIVKILNSLIKSIRGDKLSSSAQ